MVNAMSVMARFRGLQQLFGRLKEQVFRILQWATPQFERAMQAQNENRQTIFVAAGSAIMVLLLILRQFTAAVAVVAAWIALMRHLAQTDADRQRRISESYSRAVEQLASEKIEERLGGIYSLERISRESPDDYWIIMETLAAFVREHARRDDEEVGAGISGEGAKPTPRGTDKKRPATDIAAVLAVIARRPVPEQNREIKENRFFDLSGTDLRGASLIRLRLEYGDLSGAHLAGVDLQGAQLRGAHLEYADLGEAHLRIAHLEGAILQKACLKGACLQGAHLEGAHLRGAHLEGAHLRAAHLEKADVEAVHFEGAYLVDAHLEGVDLNKAIGDAKTWLPNNVPRPERWPPFQPWPARQ
jgi:Pentapeptide repeats (8 copies)